MATGVFDTYNTAGIREDLADRIWDVSPTDTPVASSIPKNRASQTNHEWQVDVLAAPEQSAAVEGDDAPDDSSVATTRLGNYTQIITKSAIVSGTNEQVDAAGRDSEMAYQIARRMEEIKTNIEFAVSGRTIGAGAAGRGKLAGDDTTARAMGAFQAYLTTNVDVGPTGGAAPTGPWPDGTDTGATDGTDRDFDEALLTGVLATAYTNGSKATMLVESAVNKGVSSGFNGGTTRYNTADDKKLVASIDVYAGDFHTLEIMPSRIIAAADVLVIDPEYAALSELRPMFDKELGDTGDSWKRQVIWEGTLEVRNERAHALVTDTNG